MIIRWPFHSFKNPLIIKYFIFVILLSLYLYIYFLAKYSSFFSYLYIVISIYNFSMFLILVFHKFYFALSFCQYKIKYNIEKILCNTNIKILLWYPVKRKLLCIGLFNQWLMELNKCFYWLLLKIDTVLDLVEITTSH